MRINGESKGLTHGDCMTTCNTLQDDTAKDDTAKDDTAKDDTAKDDTAKDDKPKVHILNNDSVDHYPNDDDISKAVESGGELSEGYKHVSNGELPDNHLQKALESTAGQGKGIQKN
jgi:hypothetical protein